MNVAKSGSEKGRPRRASAGQARGRPASERTVVPVDEVAVAAYYHAERRGFAPGFELDDWLAAESELALRTRPRRAPSRSRKPPAA